MEKYKELNETEQAKINTWLAESYAEWFEEIESGLTKKQRAEIEAHKKYLEKDRHRRIQLQENRNHLSEVFDGLLSGQ